MNPDQRMQVKEELFQIFRRLEMNFNDEDDKKLKELRSQYLTEPAFFREWMMYDRLVIVSMLEPHKKESSKMYNEAQADYIGVKHSSENTEFYKNELKAWKDANGIK